MPDDSRQIRGNWGNGIIDVVCFDPSDNYVPLFSFSYHCAAIWQAPTIENLVFLSDNSFDIESLVVMEHTVLKMLDFNVSVHTSYYFGTRLALAAQMTEKEKSFMFFLIGELGWLSTASALF